jgi:hypothetical protein
LIASVGYLIIDDATFRAHLELQSLPAVAAVIGALLIGVFAERALKGNVHDEYLYGR